MNISDLKGNYTVTSSKGVNIPSPQVEPSNPSLSSRVSSDISTAGSEVRDAIEGQGKYQGESSIRRGTEATEKAFGTPLKVADEILPEPVRNVSEKVGQAAGSVVSWLGDKIGGTKVAQDFVAKHPDAAKFLEEASGTGAALGGTAGDILGTESVVKGIPKSGEKIAGSVARAGEHVSSVTKDVIPSSERIVNHQVTKALDLTQGDVKNISLSTGHEVGKFLADNNLIGKNKDITVKNVGDFFNKNYDAVRSEVSKVGTKYKQYNVPRYVESLKAIQKKIKNVPGLQDTEVEVENLINKKDIKLTDVQRAKELLDDHFNLYKATGDVGEGVQKTGLSNIRNDLKSFIEDQVEKTTGAKIKDLNNNVAASKGIMNAVESRSTAGLTRGNLKLGDLGVFGVGTSMGGPLVGAAAVFGKKILESPSVQLRIAKFMDGISDAKKAKIMSSIRNGKVPYDLRKVTGI